MGGKTEVEWKGAFYRGFMNNDPPPELSDEASLKAVTDLYKAGLASLNLAAFRVLLDVVDGVLHCLDLLGVFVGNLHIERFFKLHHELDHVERVSTQVLLEAGAGRHLGFIHLQLLDNDLLHLFFNGHAFFSSMLMKTQ